MATAAAAPGAKLNIKRWDRSLRPSSKPCKPPYHVTDECAVLIELLTAELSTVKAQLTNVTQSLNAFTVVFPQSHHDFKPSKTLKKYPVFKTFSPSQSKDPPLLIPICTEQPPISLPGLISRSSKQSSEKVKKIDASTSSSFTSSEVTQHFLDVVDRHEEERAKARNRYLTLMRNRIDTQLQQFAEREKQIKRRKEKREKREKAARVQNMPSRFRSTGVDNRTHLENIYQSYLYKIINVEHGLRQCGKLKNTAELKAFWEEMLTPLQTPAPTKPAASTSSSTDLIEKELLSLQEEDFTDSWAITSSGPSYSKQPKYASPSASAVPTPLKFVSCKLPDLKPIKEILDDGSDDQNLKKLLGHSNMHQSPSVKLRKRTQLLYQRAKANEMAMRTLLPCGEESSHPSFSGSLLSSMPSPAMQHCTLVLPPHSGTNDKLDLKAMEPDTTDHQLSVKATASKSIDLPSSSSINTSSKPACVPLTMSELMQSSSVKESKGGLMWTNYQLAGKLH